MLGFARAARDLAAPLLLARPSGSADEKGPEEARDDTSFVESAIHAAEGVRFFGPMAFLKEPPRKGSAVPERDRILREIETGFTGVAVTARPDTAASARDAALVAAQVCQRELGLEIVPLGGSPELGLELVRQLASRGAPPSALRVPDEEGVQAAARAPPESRSPLPPSCPPRTSGSVASGSWSRQAPSYGLYTARRRGTSWSGSSRGPTRTARRWSRRRRGTSDRCA